jgi:hypothetical protein
MQLIELPFFSQEECDEIKTYAYEVEKQLTEQGFENFKSERSVTDAITTNNFFRYNFFQAFPHHADRLASFLSQTNPNLDWPIVVQSWVNIYRNGQGIEWHNHTGTIGKSFTANIFISGPTTPGITYKEFNQKAHTVENKVGYIHMIPCELYHSVPAVEGDEDRITVGITMHSYQTIQRNMLDQLAFNSKMYQDTIILTKEHFDGARENI